MFEKSQRLPTQINIREWILNLDVIIDLLGDSAKYRNLYYQFQTNQKNYADAKSYCDNNNGRLVTVKDPALQAFLYSFVNYQSRKLVNILFVASKISKLEFI